MKHACKNCINCNLVSKDSRGYKTLCRLRPDLIHGKVERCIAQMPPLASLTFDEKVYLTVLKNTNFMGNK
jgi:hypothetical protein